MSIFRPEILEALGIQMDEATLDQLENVLKDECKFLKVPYTRQYLKTIIATVKRFVMLGNINNSRVMFNTPQISYAVCVEKLLERYEKKFEEGMKNLEIKEQ